MKRFSKFILAAASGLLTIVSVNAQSWVELDEDATPVICISETINEAPDVVEIFQSTQSPYHHDPRAPRFVLVDQQGKWVSAVICRQSSSMTLTRLSTM